MKGELEKRLEEEASAQRKREIMYKPPTIPIGTFLNWIDEARKEFLEYANIFLPMGTCRKQRDNLLTEKEVRNQWFKKWFGDENVCLEGGE